ncbi:MAG: hypothetical protein R3E83_12535 [Burkholderiaceae bacterium]
MKRLRPVRWRAARRPVTGDLVVLAALLSLKAVVAGLAVVRGFG